MTNDDEGEGGVTIPPKNDDVIYEQPLMCRFSAGHNARVLHFVFSRFGWLVAVIFTIFVVVIVSHSLKQVYSGRDPGKFCKVIPKRRSGGV